MLKKLVCYYRQFQTHTQIRNDGYQLIVFLLLAAFITAPSETNAST